MSQTPDEFGSGQCPEGEMIRWLEQRDVRFAQLAEACHQLSGVLHRIECGIEPASHARTQAIRRARLALLDELAAMIASARQEQ